MGRINTNVSSLIAQRTLAKNNSNLNTSLERLSTGLKINSGKDDPAGLIASENLRAEKTGITQAIDNAGRASNVVATAEGGLGEISNLLNEVQGLVSQSANSGGLSSEEKDANQLQVDSILNTINRLSNSTQFQGKKLLDGSLDYRTANLDATKVTDLHVNSARITDGATLDVVVNVTGSAQTAVVSGPAAALGSGGATVRIAGNLGSQQLSFASGATVSNIADAVNAVSNATGVKAVTSGGSVYLNSADYGSKSFVTVETLSGTFATDTTDFGQNLSATVNGAQAQTDGLNIQYRSELLDVNLNATDAINFTGGAAQQANFSISGGGATFALGTKVTENDKASFGIGSVSTSSLGTTAARLSSLGSGGVNNLTGDNLTTAQKSIDAAIKQVSQLRGRLGAFQKFTIGSTINNLGVAYENVSASESAIRDTNFAEETAALTRSQILSQAATTVLTQANSAPQQALALLR